MSISSTKEKPAFDDDAALAGVSPIAPTGGSVRDDGAADALGVQTQHFSLAAAVGVNYSLIGTPLAIGTYLAFNIGIGGGPVFIFGYILTLVFQLTICACLAEVAACYPNSSGQVFWTAMLAPRQWSRSLSYWAGAFTLTGWVLWTVTLLLFTSQLLFALVSICHDAFSEQAYQVYLGYLAAALAGLLLNTVFFKFYSVFIRSMVLLINGGAIVVLVSLLVRAVPKQSADFVFTEFLNFTGWENNGLVFFLGLLPGLTSINGFDAAAHLTDEIPMPGRRVPQVMWWTAVVAGLAGLPMTFVFYFCVVDADALLDPIGGQPIAQLFLDSLDLLPLTIFIMIIYLFIFFIAGAVIITTTSRVIWSLARESHLPGSRWLSKTSGIQNLPLNATYAATFISVLLGLLCLGVTAAVNSFGGAAIICLFVSYTIPLVCSLLDRSKVSSTPHSFNLGKFGPILSLISVLWMILMSVFLCFPQYIPPTAASMNYAVVILGIVFVLFGMNWLILARKIYRDPSAPVLEAVCL